MTKQTDSTTYTVTANLAEIRTIYTTICKAQFDIIKRLDEAKMTGDKATVADCERRLIRVCDARDRVRDYTVS